MATTRHDSTAHCRSEELLLLKGPDKPGHDLGCAPRLCTAAPPTCQETAISSLRVDEPSLSGVVTAVEIALTSHLRSGGATVSLCEGNLAGRKLFSVAIYPERTIEFKTPPTWEQLFAFATANFDLLLQPGHALGTWFDRERGVHTLDVVICLVDRDEAIRLGEHFHQSAIFDLAAGRDIFLAAHQTGHVGAQR